MDEEPRKRRTPSAQELLAYLIFVIVLGAAASAVLGQGCFPSRCG